MKNGGIVVVLFCLLISVSALADQRVLAVKVDTNPVVDGLGTDSIWQAAPTVTTLDLVMNIPIELQAAYSDRHLFMKVRFPDSTENRDHKTLLWNSDLEVYRTSFKREDSFVFKWSMEPVPVELSLKSEHPYRADVWLWKAFRTDPLGYADDKLHIYGSSETKKSKPITLASGRVLYLTRSADDGISSYMSKIYEKYSGDSVVRYKHREPKGSRADVRAKGHWSEGYWTIEFQRELTTSQADDIQFNPSLTYAFGVSRHEIAGKTPNSKLEQPFYESGDVGERLTLTFHE